MKAIRLYGSRDHPRLVCEDAPDPAPGPGQVAVRVRAAAVTPTELQWAPTWTTRAGGPRPLPVIPGHEFSGVVIAVAPGVTGVAAGDAVFGLNDWFSDGAQAECCLARADDIASKPRSVDHVEAAAVPISALTAWQGLVDRAHLGRGERVLVHGAAGAVGTCAVQIARQRGAYVIGTAAAHNLAFVRALGADEVIDYRAGRFEDAVRDVDVVFDTVGGETLERSWSVLASGGRLVTIAAAGEASQSPRVQAAFFIVEANRAQLTEIARLIDAGLLRPIVGTVFPLTRGAEAYAARPQHGKSVLQIAP
jgi:NADPH:quinone reductase-like Zn-dependent oxidoreductase